MAAAIEIRNVSKRFRLYHEQYKSLKERVLHGGRIPYEEFWALRDVELTIEQGETFGVLGHNGSGKSTLLKCIAGILKPTSGDIVTHGRLAAMLELGTGFHPDLTGRENVFLNAALLGIPRKHIESIFDSIVAFAEMEQFIDQQVKHYSSGMYVRLGFAVAIHMDPEILLIDEVLAVGDEAFQRKCLDRVQAFQREGRTILLVTHDAESVRRLCSRAAVLERGEMIMVGESAKAVQTLREHLFAIADHEEFDAAAPTPDVAESTAEALPDATAGHAGESPREDDRHEFGIRVLRVRVVHAEQDARRYVLHGESLDIEVDYVVDGRIEDAKFGVAIYDESGHELWGTDTEILGVDVPPVSGEGTIRYRITRVPFLGGRFSVTVGATSVNDGVVYDWRENAVQFEVMRTSQTAGVVGVPVEVTLDAGPASRAVAPGALDT